MCCTGNEIAMRHNVPMAGNFFQQELAIVTGVVDAMVVDVQCIMPALSQVAKCYHTKLITTSPKAKIPGAIHMQFDEAKAIESAKNRSGSSAQFQKQNRKYLHSGRKIKRISRL